MKFERSISHAGNKLHKPSKAELKQLAFWVLVIVAIRFAGPVFYEIGREIVENLPRVIVIL